jgi:hypothetical protein
MGWSLKRWKESTLYEFNCAAAGFWKSWERNVAWLAREINYIAIAGNPNIKPSQKPRTPTDLYKLSTDHRPEKSKKLTPEEIETIKKSMFDGISKQPDSKD